MAQVTSPRSLVGAGDGVYVEILLRRLRMSAEVTSNIFDFLSVPRISISQNALPTAVSSQDDPRDGHCVVDLRHFEDAVSIFGERQRRMYMDGARRFFALFECRARGLNLMIVFGKIYEEGLLEKVFRLQIMNTTSAWARHVVYALDRLLDFIIVQAEIENRMEIKRYAVYCKMQFVYRIAFVVILH